MNKVLLTFLLLGASLSIQAQAYLGHAKSNVNFRAEPSTKAAKLGLVKKGTKFFVLDKEEIDKYYHVINMDSHEVGYIYASYIVLDKPAPKQEPIFKQFGKTMSNETSLRISNNTDKEVTLKLNEEVYTFTPKQKTVLTLPGGTYTFLVTVAGELPLYGEQTIEKGHEYIWSYTGE